jgi:hypothetical protein
MERTLSSCVHLARNNTATHNSNRGGRHLAAVRRLKLHTPLTVVLTITCRELQATAPCNVSCATANSNNVPCATANSNRVLYPVPLPTATAYYLYPVPLPTAPTDCVCMQVRPRPSTARLGSTCSQWQGVHTWHRLQIQSCSTCSKQPLPGAATRTEAS